MPPSCPAYEFPAYLSQLSIVRKAQCWHILPSDDKPIIIEAILKQAIDDGDAEYTVGGAWNTVITLQREADRRWRQKDDYTSWVFEQMTWPGVLSACAAACKDAIIRHREDQLYNTIVSSVQAVLDLAGVSDLPEAHKLLDEYRKEESELQNSEE